MAFFVRFYFAIGAGERPLVCIRSCERPIVATLTQAADECYKILFK
jgi:hypothetical protein